jgi:exosortase
MSVLQRFSVMPEKTGVPTLRTRLFELAVAVLLAVSYWPVFSLYAQQQWTTGSLQGAYNHAWLALAAAAWLVWRQRGLWAAPGVPADSPAGWGWLSLGVFLKMYGEYHAYDVLQGISLVPTLAGLTMLRFGSAGWSRLRYPVLFLLFVIPLPDAAIDEITRPLIGLTAAALRWLLPLSGLEVGGAGQYLLLSDPAQGIVHELILAPECSGIRSLVTLLALASLVAHLHGLRAVAGTWLMLMALPLTLFGNVLRVSLLALGMVHVSPEAAQAMFHDFSGILLFVVNLFGLLTFAWWLDRRQGSPVEGAA